MAAYWSANRRHEAQSVLDAALRKNPTDLDALLQRAEVSLVLNRYAEAKVDIDAALHENPNSAEAHYLSSRVSALRGNWRVEQQELSETLRLDPAALRVRLELAELLLRTNGAKLALEVLDDAPQDQKRAVRLVVDRNWALIALGDMTAARRGIDSGLAEQRSPDLLIQDGLWKLQRGEVAAGRSAFEQVLAVSPEDLRALGALMQFYAAQKQTAAGLKRIRQYAAKVPRSAPVQSFLGHVLMANGRNAEARAVFIAACAASPNFRSAEMGLMELDIADDKFDAARERLNKLLASNPNDTAARLWLANIDEMRGEHESALKAYRELLEMDPTTRRY